MIEFMRLMWRKNRIAYLGFSGAFAVSWIAAVIVTLNWPGVALQANAQMLAIFWLYIGLPVMALVLGASSGAELRASLSADADAPLPLSAVARALGAYLAQLSFLLAAAAVIMACIIALGASAMLNSFVPLTSFALAGTLYLFSAAFVFSYIFMRGTEGGLAALAFTAALMVFSWLLGFNYETHVIVAWDWFIMLLACAGMFAALFYSAQRLQLGKKLRIKGILALAGLICLPQALGYFSYFYINVRIRKAYVPIETEWPLGKFSENREIDGMLLGNGCGGLVYAMPDGSLKTLLPENGRFFGSSYPHAEYDVDGKLLALRRTPSIGSCDYELFAGTKESGLERVSKFESEYQADGLHRIHRQVFIFAFDRRTSYVAPLPEAGRLPVYSEYGAAIRREYEKAYADGNLAYVDRKSKKALVSAMSGGKKTVWTLPLRPAGDQRYLPALRAGGKTLFAVPVISPGTTHYMAVCLPDGRIKLEWPGTNYNILRKSLSGGAYWRGNGQHLLEVITPDGKFLPPVEIKEAGFIFPWRNEMLRYENGMAWLLIEPESGGLDFVARVNLRSGKIEANYQLPQSGGRKLMVRNVFSPGADGGCLYYGGYELWRINPDGTSVLLLSNPFLRFLLRA